MEPQIVTAFHPALGRMVPFKEAENGLACGCICTLCGQALIAVQGMPAWHYRHYEASACPGGSMTALHNRAIGMLLAQDTFSVGAERISYRDPTVREKVGHFIPDITAISGGEKLLLEVRVTHACEATKIAYYREMRYASLEFDLSYLPYDIDDEMLYEELITNGENKRWLYQPEATSPAPVSTIAIAWEKIGMLALAVGAILWFACRKPYRGKQR